MSACRVCGGALEAFLDFGRMPIANGFLRREDFASEAFFDLAAAFCERCALVQLVEAIPRERLFHPSYPFFTSSSEAMAAHFERLGAEAMALAPRGDAIVVEIGSNDGTLLQPLAAAGIRHLGVEPSAGVAAVARSRGVRTLERFFDEDCAARITAEQGEARLVIATNCFCHVADLDGLGRALERLLAPDGVIVFEDPYLGEILAKTAYDQFYDEHVSYFSLDSVTRWLARHGLEVLDARPQEVHGGSMRYTVARRGRLEPSSAVAAWRAREALAGLGRIEPLVAFRSRVERSREELVALLRGARDEGRRVVGYGATSKSTTVLNYCAIGSDLVEFVSDTTPAKQGRYTPGTHIPVRRPEEFASRYPDYALLFAWNHASEIFAKERAFRAAGGRWIAYVPGVAVLD